MVRFVLMTTAHAFIPSQLYNWHQAIQGLEVRSRGMGLLPDTQNCAPGMPGTFPRQRLQRKPQVSDSGKHHVTCVTHVPWCMPGSLTRGGGENVPGIPCACATRNFAYLVRGPCLNKANTWVEIEWCLLQYLSSVSHWCDLCCHNGVMTLYDRSFYHIL